MKKGEFEEAKRIEKGIQNCKRILKILREGCELRIAQGNYYEVVEEKEARSLVESYYKDKLESLEHEFDEL